MHGLSLSQLFVVTLLLSIAVGMSGCATQVKCQCPEMPKVPKELMQPAKNNWLALPTLSETAQKTQVR